VLSAHAADGTSISPATARVALSLRPIAAGTITGLQLLVEPTHPSPPVAHLVVRVQGPPMDPAKRPEKPLHIAARRLLQGNFLNGPQVASIDWPAPDAPKSALPTPPGSHRVTWRHGNEIVAVELAPLAIGPDDLHVLRLDHHGTALPIGGVLGDKLWFYAPRRITDFARTDSAFLDPAAAQPSGPIATRPAFQTLAPQGTEVALTQTRRFERNLRYERFLPLPVGHRFLWHAVQRPATSTIPATATIALPIHDALTTATVQLRPLLRGANATPPHDPDHFADFILAGTPLPRTTWTGQTWHEPLLEVALDPLPATGPWLLEHRVANGTPVLATGVDGQRLDSVELTWTGYPRIGPEGRHRLELPASPQPRRITIGGLPPGTTPADLALLDVTQPHQPVRITLEAQHLFAIGGGATALEFEAPADQSVYHLQLLASHAAPLFAGAAELLPAPLPPQRELHGIFVRPPAHAPALEPLAALRGSGRLLHLDPQAAYNAYSGGQESPEAIRQTLAALLEAHPNRLPFPSVLLVGHATLDPRDEMGLLEFPQVPCFIEESVLTEFGRMENPIDYPYAMLQGDDLLPDVMLGRLPARTTADVQLAVQRIRAHHALAPALSQIDRPGVFIADQDNNFRADQSVWAARWHHTGNSTILIKRPDYTTQTAAQQAIREAIESPPGGAAFVMYNGHGFNDTWWNSTVMSPARVRATDTENRWPIVATFTCLNGYYAFPGNTVLTLAEAWLFSTASGTLRGAVANIAPCSVDFYLEQRYFALAVLDSIAQDAKLRPDTIGGIMLQAQTSYITDFPSLGRTLREYILFGDPLTRFAIDTPETPVPSAWAIQ
jgi:hypothetical protein